MKKTMVFGVLLILLFCLNGAWAQEAEELPNPVADAQNADVYQVQLYFRFLNEPYLACETRTLTVKKDESLETAIVRTILSGPGAASAELRRLFSDDVTVESTSWQDKLLFVTLSENVTEAMGDEPLFWQNDAYWQREVPLRRQLAMQSLAATLIENCGCEAVQIMLDARGDAKGSMRLPMSYYRTGREGLAPLLHWDDKLLLTPGYAAKALLESYQQKDWERVLRYVTVAPGSTLPNPAIAAEMMDQWLTLVDYQLGESVVDLTGTRAVLACDATLARAPGDEQKVTAHPLRLVRTNGIWKIQWSELEGLLNRW